MVLLPARTRLRRRAREPGADQLDHLSDGEAAREHHRLGAAVAAKNRAAHAAEGLRITATGTVSKRPSFVGAMMLTSFESRYSERSRLGVSGRRTASL